jgi:23S rRNA (guanosine2251-2'-O)-methyltransferase
MDLIYGIHSVYECLRFNSKAVERIYCSQGSAGRRLQEIIDLARKLGIPVKFEPSAALDRKTGHAAHQGVVAVCGAQSYTAFEDILTQLSAQPLLIILDSITDPRNLGAVLRTSAVFGVDGVIIPKDNAAGLSSTVSKTAEGAVEHVRVARVTNLVRAIQMLKEHGVWVIGLESGQQTRCDQVDYNRSIALVFGNEGVGLRRLVRENCDILASIVTPGPLHSLNVSVAAGIAIYEVVRYRRGERVKDVK